MIAYVGFTGLKGNFARTHASLSTAAVAFSQAGGDVVATINRLIGVGHRQSEPPMKVVALNEGIPDLPCDAGLIIAGDFEEYGLNFFAPVLWTGGDPQWWAVGALTPHFALADIESVESSMALTNPAPKRRLAVVRK